VALGRLEPVGGVLEIGAAMGDRLRELKVREGATVEADKPVAELDSQTLREFELRSITCQREEAEARRKAEEQAANARIALAQVSVEKAELQQQSLRLQEQKCAVAKAALEVAENDAKRLANLSEDLASAQDRERQALLVKQAQAECLAADTTLEQLQKTNALALKAARAELDAATAAKGQVLSAIPVRSLEIGCDLAKTQLERTTLRSPIAGRVMRIFVREGELLRGTPIMQIADVSQMQAVVEVHEDAVGRVRVGQKAEIRARALPESLDGEVAQVGMMIYKPELKGVDPFAPTDRHVVQVRVKLKDSQRVANFTNLEVEVAIQTAE
jgi:HlyD family secretion protein